MAMVSNIPSDRRRATGIVTTAACAVLALALSACSSSASGGGGANGSGEDTSLPAILTYKGSDRAARLEAQAKKEGAFVLYTSNTATEAAAKEFGKKHPDIKVTTYLAKATDLLTRLKTEYAADKVAGDAIGMSNSNIPEALENGYLAQYYSPAVNEQPKETVKPGDSDGLVWFAADREDYTVMGWNTKKVKASDAPRTYDDLLDGQWKGKMAISGHTTGINWLGVVVDSKGKDFVEKLRGQDIRVQDVSAAALTDLVSSGEVPLSPNLGLSDVIKLKAKGAPLDWAPLEPAAAAGGSDGIVTKAKHPAAALMFIDYLHSKEGQQLMVGQGVISPRQDVPTPGLGEIKLESLDLSTKYSVEEYAAKYSEWQSLMQQTFVS
jgi:iron(III) transport system substrate-binding protein